MDILKPFLDILGAVYQGIVNIGQASGTSAKLMASIQLLDFAVYVPAAITNAPQALSAFENLSDDDRKAVESYLAGKIPTLSADQVTKVVAGLDVVIRVGATVPSIIVLFKSVASAAKAAAPKPELGAAGAQPAPPQPKPGQVGAPAPKV